MLRARPFSSTRRVTCLYQTQGHYRAVIRLIWFSLRQWRPTNELAKLGLREHLESSSADQEWH